MVEPRMADGVTPTRPDCSFQGFPEMVEGDQLSCSSQADAGLNIKRDEILCWATEANILKRTLAMSHPRIYRGRGCGRRWWRSQADSQVFGSRTQRMLGSRVVLSYRPEAGRTQPFTL